MGAQMKAVLGLMAVLAAGCANEVGRYQMISIPPGTVWRMDTRTGELEACGFEAGKPACHSFPAPPQRHKG
jgi:hypothetical protein